MLSCDCDIADFHVVLGCRFEALFDGDERDAVVTSLKLEVSSHSQPPIIRRCSRRPLNTSMVNLDIGHKEHLCSCWVPQGACWRCSRLCLEFRLGDRHECPIISS